MPRDSTTARSRDGCASECRIGGVCFLPPSAARERVARTRGGQFDELRVDLIGSTSLNGRSFFADEHPYEVRLRVAARAATAERAALVGDEVEALYTNGPAGGGGTRKYVQEQVGIVSTLIDRDLPWLIALVRRSKTWAYVDWIAPKVIGDVIARYPRAKSLLVGWSNDDDFWVRRTALLAEHDALRRGAGDFVLWSRVAATMLDEREFFIRKAIGWVLREVSKKRPELTFAFLREHRARVSSLSLQEGAKYLSASQRRALGLPAEASWIERERRRKVAGAR